MKKKIEFASHPANLWLVRLSVRQFLQQHPFTDREMELMVLGIDEACTNIIRHAYHLIEDQPIILIFENIRDGAVRFSLRDYGEGFDLNSVQSRPYDHQKPGGLGLHLIRHAFDQINYSRKSKGTLLILVKHRQHPVARIKSSRAQELH
jgi:serine/threonine-protein kinase RsbW